MTAFAVEAVTVVAPDGVALRGQRWAGGAAWVILLHDAGAEEDLDRWAPLAPVLAARGWTVLTVDLRGHGASDGEWDPARIATDLAALVAFGRAQGAAAVAIAGAGAVATAVLASVAACRPDALVLLSPRLAPGQSPSGLRGAGEAKLILVGGGDEAARHDSERLAKAAIGWVMHVSLPANEQGTALLAGPAARHLTEHVAGFLAERRFLAGQPPGNRVDPSNAAGARAAATGERSGSV